MEKTFELMKAYAELGLQERKIIEYLFKLDRFVGDYAKLAKEIGLDYRNLRNSLKYLDALGLVFIANEKYLDEVEFKTNRNGKTYTSYNKMKYCFLVLGWEETLVYYYQTGKIFYNQQDKIKYVKEKTKELYQDMELEYKE